MNARDYALRLRGLAAEEADLLLDGGNDRATVHLTRAAEQVLPHASGRSENG